MPCTAGLHHKHAIFLPLREPFNFTSGTLLCGARTGPLPAVDTRWPNRRPQDSAGRAARAIPLT
jgi:hypothetical protein